MELVFDKCRKFVQIRRFPESVHLYDDWDLASLRVVANQHETFLAEAASGLNVNINLQSE